MIDREGKKARAYVIVHFDHDLGIESVGIYSESPDTLTRDLSRTVALVCTGKGRDYGEAKAAALRIYREIAEDMAARFPLAGDDG